MELEELKCKKCGKTINIFEYQSFGEMCYHCAEHDAGCE